MNQQDNNQKKSDVALREEKVLAYWQERDIFQKTLNKKSPKGEFVFYDGPPYATGLPHYGHLLPGTMKDVIPRYKTMQGYRVPRQWGWDCHGLPIENLIQKELELPTKQDIVDYGIEKFNQAARDSVLRYEKDWKEYIPRVGRFVDMADPYKTMDISYMEGVWGVFKNLHDKGLVYKGYKSMMVSPPLETVLSNQEVNMGGYKDITDLSVTAKFTITDGKHKGVHLLAWTTTPWTLPGNALVAVGADIDYGIIRSEDETYVVGLDLLESAFEGKEYEVLETVKGQDLVGVSYEPPFSYFKNHANAFRVVAGDFVTTEDGTGLVHIAPGFGEDDLQLGQKENVEPIHHVKMDGHFVKKVEQSLSDEGYDVAGWAVKNTDDHMHVDVEMVKYLAHNGKLFSKKKYNHSYPMCWRTDCPLINYATESWFIDVQQIKDNLIANNKETNWIPQHIRDGRFGKWLEEVRDWSVSRSRFWGTPLPIWEKENGENVVVDSVEALKKYAKKSSNTYFVMRHGEAEKNIENIVSSTLETAQKHPLTQKGEKLPIMS
jgi:isoleucyl-tRNA synthetase